jgi:Uncharacterized protein conserved in bacteria
MSKGSFFRTSCILISLALAGVQLLPAKGEAKENNRFSYSGDGTLLLAGQSVTFRETDGSYSEAGLKRIHQIFSAPWADVSEHLSLRFLEILDYVQDHFGGGSYSLKSGYRSPGSNQKLRNQGKLAAQSSMHTEGAAADLSLQGTASSEVFDFVKSLNCCGIGWYHSRHFHIDTGPARYWDEATSKTEDKTPQQNEKIILQPDFDRYRPGEEVALKFMRVTEYPIGVPTQIELVAAGSATTGAGSKLPLLFAGLPAAGDCKVLESRAKGRTLSVRLPDKNPTFGNHALRVKFCNRFGYEKMPQEIISRQFEILQK